MYIHSLVLARMCHGPTRTHCSHICFTLLPNSVGNSSRTGDGIASISATASFSTAVTSTATADHSHHTAVLLTTDVYHDSPFVLAYFQIRDTAYNSNTPSSANAAKQIAVFDTTTGTRRHLADVSCASLGVGGLCPPRDAPPFSVELNSAMFTTITEGSNTTLDVRHRYRPTTEPTVFSITNGTRLGEVRLHSAVNRTIPDPSPLVPQGIYVQLPSRDLRSRATGVVDDTFRVNVWAHFDVAVESFEIVFDVHEGGLLEIPGGAAQANMLASTHWSGASQGNTTTISHVYNLRAEVNRSEYDGLGTRMQLLFGATVRVATSSSGVGVVRVSVSSMSVSGGASQTFASRYMYEHTLAL